MFYDWLEKKVIEKIENEKVFCKNCNDWETTKITKDFTTRKCKCGVSIFRPRTPERDFAIKRFVSAEEYFANKEIEKENLEKDLNGLGIVVKNGKRKRP